MFFADYHTHSRHSPDGSAAMRELADAAVRSGLSELAITDHCDVGPFCYSAFDAKARRREFLETRGEFAGRLRLVYAVELGEALHNPERAADVLAEDGYDFVIGSHHVLKGGEDFWAMSFPDAAHCSDIISRYLGELIEMAGICDFDALGHLTYPLRYMNGREHMGVSFTPHMDKTAALFRALISSGKGIELNVSGLGGPWGRPMPELELLKLFRSLGGELVTVGTDAHAPEKVGANLREGYELLRQAGFTRVASFSERKPHYERII